MLVTIERMEALVAIIESGSFSGAARKLDKTPSAVSRIIQHFELDLGVDLFERREGQAPVATLTARNLYQQAVEILPRLQILENKAQDCQEGVESKLVLAIHGLAFTIDLQKALKQLVEKFPGLDLVIVDPQVIDVDQALIDGEIDLVFMPGATVPTRAVSYRRFGIVEWCMVVSSDHPLARRRGELTEADLLEYTQLLPTPGGSISEEQVEALRICPRHISCQRIFQIQELLFAGMGFASLPKYVVQPLLETGHLKELNLESSTAGLNAWDTEVRWARVGVAGQWLLDTLEDYSAE